MNVRVRAAAAADLRAVSLLAGELVRMHHAFDAQRFLLVPGVEAGYEHFLGREITKSEAIVLVAEQGAEVVGYAYGRFQPRDWNGLLDACVALHDVFVAPSARRNGVARQLLEHFLERARQGGAPRVVLNTATQNLAAQRLFATLGFRSTMIEMTRELE